jgi:lauroyl/myristoyl acyltransferase
VPRRGPSAALARAGEGVLEALLAFLGRLLPQMGMGAVLALADLIGTLVWLLDVRGRSVARQNLEAVFGARMGRLARTRVTWCSYRNAMRNELLLFHLQPLTPRRHARLVRVSDAERASYRERLGRAKRVVLVSAHLGNWELLVIGRHAMGLEAPVAYLVESMGVPALDRVLERLRNQGSRGSAQRKHGALALKQALGQGRLVSLMMDRNLRGSQGGAYAPFLGLEARTTPLGAVLARAYDASLVVSLMLPDGPERWRLAVSANLMPPPTADAEADVREAVRRANAVLSEAILAHPEAYLWMLKRWKSRPTAERGGYPAYSVHDPEA